MSKINITDINATGTPSHSTALLGDGSWGTVSGGGGGGGNNSRVLITDVTVSGTTTAVPLTGFDSTKYLHYEIEFSGVTNSGSTLAMQCSSDGGSTYDSSGAYNWDYTLWGSGGYQAAYHGANDTSAAIVNGTNTATEGSNGLLRIFDPGNAATYTMFSGTHTSNDGSSYGNNNYGVISGGQHNAAAVTDAIQFVSPGGTFSAGRFRLYGIPIAGTGESGKPWWWNPPLASAFTYAGYDSSNPTLTDDADAGLISVWPNPIGGDQMRIEYVPLSNPAGDFVFDFYAEVFNPTTGYATPIVGIGSLVSQERLFNNQYDGTLGWGDQRYKTGFSGAGGGSGFAGYSAASNQNVHVRWTKVGTQLAAFVSIDAKTWIQLWTDTVASGLGGYNPDHVFFGVSYNRGGLPIQINVEQWDLSGSAV